MAKNFAARGDLEIDNGYRDFGSPELLLASVEANGGRIVAVPPPIFPILAYPFYRLAGWSGVFWLSTLALAGVVLLTFWSARELLGDEDVAFDATLILALATYLWPYSQAAWPHALTTLLVLASFALALATDRDGEAAVPIRAAGAGLVLGLATGVRVDAFFALPAILYGASVRSRSRLRSVVGVLVGLTPVLIGLTLANLSKFGVMSPFAYTSTPRGTMAVRSYLVPAAILALLAGFTLMSRARRADGQPLLSKWMLGAVLASAVLAGLWCPPCVPVRCAFLPASHNSSSIFASGHSTYKSLGWFVVTRVARLCRNVQEVAAAKLPVPGDLPTPFLAGCPQAGKRPYLRPARHRPGHLSGPLWLVRLARRFQRQPEIPAPHSSPSRPSSPRRRCEAWRQPDEWVAWSCSASPLPLARSTSRWLIASTIHRPWSGCISMCPWFSQSRRWR